MIAVRDEYKEVAGPRGVHPDVWRGAFFPYWQVADDKTAADFLAAWDEANPSIHEYLRDLPEEMSRAGRKHLRSLPARDLKLAARAPGSCSAR